MSRRPITLVLPYYRNAEMLATQLQLMSKLPADVKSGVQLVVVDDGTPDKSVQAKAVVLPWVGKSGFNGMGIASFQLFEVEVDVRWNWLTCRNIGVHHAKTEWVLLTDIDHVVPEPTWRRLQEQKLNPRNVYRFSRVDAPDLTPYKPHPNSWLMTKAKFDEIGGYDERFSGFYGTDGEFRDRVRSKAREIVMLENPLIRYPRAVIADASTTAYGRKEPQDHEGVTRIRAQIASEGGPTKRRSFPYHQVV